MEKSLLLVGSVTHALAEYISSLGYQVSENHRDMART